jgi:hypothetical protein
MKLIIILIATSLCSITTFAANPGVICVQSTARFIIIETQKKQVRVFKWSEVVETLPITKTDVRYIETRPGTLETSYDLGEGYVVTTSFKDGAERGTGQLLINGEVKGEYTDCSTSDDIKR